MDNESLLITFVALTAVAVVIQTGIIVGIYLATRKLESRTDRIVEQVRRMMADPADKAIDSLQKLSLTVAEYATLTQSRLRQFEQALGEKEVAWRERLSKRSAARPA